MCTSKVYEEVDFVMENICFFVGVLLLLPLLSIHAWAHLLVIVSQLFRFIRSLHPIYLYFCFRKFNILFIFRFCRWRHEKDNDDTKNKANACEYFILAGW